MSRTGRWTAATRAALVVACAVTTATVLADTPRPARALRRLTWSVPELTAATVIPITQSNRDLNLPLDRDFVLDMPDVALTGKNGLRVNGGHNVVIVGGAISVSGVPVGTSGDDRRGLVVKNQTGTVHIEGLQISGADLSEGIQVAAPRAIVQLQNIRITRVGAAGAGSFHSDVLQVWGGVRDLRVDGLTGSTSFQGIFLKSDVGNAPIGRVDLRHINIIGGGTAGYLFYADPAVGPITTSDVFGVPGSSKEWQYSTFPHLPTYRWQGVVQGTPASGDFVPQGAAGPSYTNPDWSPPASPPRLSVEPATAQEPRSPSERRSVEVRVRLDKPAGAKVFVEYSLAAGTATAGADYRDVPDGDIVFDPGQTSKSVWVELEYDGRPERTESFDLVIGDVKNAAVGARTGTASIIDG